MITLLKHYLELSKPKIVIMQLVTLAMGYVLAPIRPEDPGVLGMALLGTALVAMGSSAFNHCLERDTDRLMKRTASQGKSSR